MPMPRYRHLSVLAAALAVTGLAAPEATAAQEMPTKGYRAEFFQVLDSAEGDFVALAEAMPERLFDWRPAEGVRSYGEVCLHIAMTNFTGPNMIGSSPPAGLEREGYEQSLATKSDIVAELKRSFRHLRASVLAASDDQQDTEISGWYGPSTYRGALHIMNEHLGEHLGQSIAYARINGVVPPWNR